MENNINNKQHFIIDYTWYVPVILLLALALVSQTDLLLFHTLTGLFTAMVAVLMFVVAWQMYPFTKNKFLMFLGCGYLWVGLLDIFHTIAYKGVDVYGIANGNMAAQFWVVSRYMEAILLLSAPWFLTHKLPYRFVFYGFGLFFVITYYSIVNNFFPIMFVDDLGSISLNAISEYIVVVLLGLSVFVVWKRRQYMDKNIVHLILLSIVLTMCSEFLFSFYINHNSIANIFAHFLKFLSYWFVFMAMIKTTLQEPFIAMARDSSTYDAIPDAVLLVDMNGVIHQTNLAACDLSGLKKEELIGKVSHDLFHYSSVEKDECYLCENSREGNRVNAYEVEDSKNNRWFDFTLSPVGTDSEYKGRLEVIRDITGRKLMEQKLEDVNDLKNSIVENLPAMLFVKKAEDHCYVEWNKAAEEITGIRREEMLGKNDFDFFTHEEAEFYISMDKKVLAEGKMHDIPEETMHTKYKGVRLLHTRKIPILNHDGSPSYLLGISQDITENRETEELIRRSQKMEAVGQLSGGIAHDFNNQLGIVTGYLEFLKEFLKAEEKQSAWIRSAQKAAQRCVELTSQLLLFSRTKSPGKSTIDINGVINNIEDIINKSVTPEVKVFFQFEATLWPVVLDESELGDAVVNMVINSRDAMPHGGDIIIRTSNVYLDDEVMIADQGTRPGDYVMLEVQDNGTGMSKEVVERIFEPFFTTKPVGSGTGLGMSMVYSFVQRYDGTIKIDSTTGYGTSIRIYLPRAGEEDPLSRSVIDPDHVMVLPKGTERVLVVDDELELLNLTGEYISSLGYEVFKAVNTVDAIEILSHETIDLVFSDIVMPGGMSGYELANEIKNKYSTVKVILSSGYVGRSPTTKYDGVVVNKPYTRQEIAFQIRSVFNN